MGDFQILSRIALAAGFGAALAVAGFVLFARSRRWAVGWPGVLASIAVSLVATASGLLFNFLTTPDGSPPPPAWFQVLLKVSCIALMPGVWAMNIFGSRSLDTIPFLGGFVLNSVLWFVIGYALVGRRFARA